MKISGFLKRIKLGLTNFLNTGKEKLRPSKKVPLSYMRLASTMATVRFSAEASAASFRRNHRHEVLQAIRRNSRGLPPGFSRFARLRLGVARAIPKVLRFDALTKKWNRQPHARTEQALSLDNAMKVGAEFRKLKPAKIARRVQGGKRVRSCSAMRSMVTIMERREMLSGRA
jgi:hypothetical protein